jgi:hypothetical protein
MAHACKPSYWEGSDREDPRVKSARANGSGETLPWKYPTQDRMAQVVEHLPSKCEALTSNSSPIKITKTAYKIADIVRCLCVNQPIH